MISKTKRGFHLIKNALQKTEGIFEVALLAVIYYVVWRNLYDKADFSTYHGNDRRFDADRSAVLDQESGETARPGRASDEEGEPVVLWLQGAHRRG